MTWIKLSHDMD